MIGVTMVAANTFEAVVGRDPETRHQVTLSPECYRQLCGGAFTHEWLIVQVFRFLLERESNTQIPAELDVAAIGARFPEFEEDIARRLGIAAR